MLKNSPASWAEQYTLQKAFYSFSMSMLNDLNQWVLASLVTYGIPILFGMAYIGSLGIPFPNTFVVIAAGALVHEGLFDWRLMILACLLGSALADHSEYLLGRFAGVRLEHRFGQKAIWQQALATLDRQGGWAIFITRFWLMPLAPAVNVIAGRRFPYGRFLFLDLTGQLLWVLIYGGLGYVFVEKWKQVNQAVSGFSLLSMLGIILAWLIYVYIKKRRKARG